MSLVLLPPPNITSVIPETPSSLGCHPAQQQDRIPPPVRRYLVFAIQATIPKMTTTTTVAMASAKARTVLQLLHQGQVRAYGLQRSPVPGWY
jgi:hypothetical protein